MMSPTMAVRYELIQLVKQEKRGFEKLRTELSQEYQEQNFALSTA